MTRAKDRVAIVTGGGKGIGTIYAKALASEGAAVVVADIVDASDVARRIQSEVPGAKVMSSQTDVSDESAVIRLVAATADRFGKIDILVNNAAVFATLPLTRIQDISVEQWDKVMAVNVRGVFLMCKHVVPYMVSRGYGKIINIGSGLAYKGSPHLLHYATSKGAIITFTRSLSRELGQYGIRVNTLAPGLTFSDTILQNKEHVETYRDIAVSSRALKRDAVPEDLIGALLFLASSASDFVTGQTLAVDGGSINT